MYKHTISWSSVTIILQHYRSFYIVLQARLLLTGKQLFKRESTHFAASEDGWTSKTFFAAADQHGETSEALATYSGNVQW